ncbi:MAG TPA: NHL repeat-containing protein, partial [Terrimicrobiaceae bacterium]
AVDQHRNVYTTSHVGDRSFAVRKFDPEGKSLVPVKENLDFPAWGLAVDNKDNVYFTVPAKHIVWKAIPDAKDAKSTYTVREFVSMWPTPKVVEPYGVAVDGKGNVYVADDRVLHKFDPYAKALPPVKEGPTTTPLHVTLDGPGNVYFTLGHAADKASPKPNSAEYNVETFVKGLNNTAGIAVDSTGQAYVADFNSGKIHTHSSKGAQLSHVFRHPHGLAVDSSNNLYIADAHGVSKACRLHIFVRHGASEQIAAE